MRRLLLLVALVAGGTLAWALLRDRPARLQPLRLAPYENVLAAFLDGELVRTTSALYIGTSRALVQTTEADPRDGERASGLLTRPDGQPPYAWLVGERLAITLDVLQPLDRELLVELANGTGGPQTVEVAFNDVPVARRELPVADTLLAVTAPVPAALQRRGGNRVELRFTRTEMRQLVDMDRPLPLAAVLRQVTFMPPGLTRAPPPPPPARAGVLEDEVAGGATNMLLLPPDTAARAPLRLPAAPRLVLRFVLEKLHAPLEVSLQLDGGRAPLRTVQPGPGPSELEFDLTPWAGQPAVLELWAREARDGSELAARVSTVHLMVPESWQPAREPPPGTPTAAAQRPSFLVVVLDAFARRYMNRVLDGQLVSPALDALAANGLFFTDATAPASYTLASVGALLTGQSPLTHGVLATTGADGLVQRLAPDAPSLASELRARGWRTAAWMTNPNGGARHGFAAGFERFEELFDPALGLFRPGHGVSGDLLPARLSDFLQSVAGEPFLAYVHVFEPHAPYEAPPDITARFVHDYAGPVEGSYDWISAFRNGQVGCDEAGWQHLRELYAARAALADRILGRLLTALVRAGRDADTYVVVLSDHGESLGEGGLLEHGDALPPEQIDSVLVLAGPALGVGRRDGPATVQDVAPTLLRLSGQAPPAGMEGVDLLAGALDTDRPLAAVSSVWLPELSWRRGAEELRVDLLTRRVRLFDMTLDPEQAHDLAQERPATCALLLRELCAHVCAAETARAARAAAGAGDASPLDPQAAAQLHTIGYAGAAPPGANDPPLRLCARLRALLRRL